jgi:hypothetical protein
LYCRGFPALPLQTIPKVVLPWISGFAPPDLPESCTAVDFRLYSSRPLTEIDFRENFVKALVYPEEKWYNRNYQ